MADKFLNTGGSGNSNISNGTATIFGATIGADNLDASKPIKTNSTKQLISTNLDIADINSLQSELEVKPNLTLIKNDTQTDPATNGIKVYAKLDGNLYKRDSTGTESGFGGASTFQQIYDGSTPALITTATTKPLVIQTGSADTDTLIACSDLVGTKNFSVKANGEMVVKNIKSTTGNIDLELDDTIFNLTSSTKSIKIIPSTNTIDFYNGSSKVGGLTTALSGIYNDMVLTTDTFSVKSLTANEDYFRVWNEGTYTSFEMKDSLGATVGRFSTNGGVGNPNTFNIESFLVAGSSDGKINATAVSDFDIVSNSGNINLTTNNPTILKNTTNTNTISINSVSNIIDIKEGATSQGYIQSSSTATTIESANALFLVSQGNTTLQATTGQVLCNQTPTTVNSVVNKAYVDSLATPNVYDLNFAATDEVNTITTTGVKMTLIVPRDLSVTNIRYSLNTAGGSNFTLKFRRNGTVIATTTFTGTTVLVSLTFSLTTLDEIELEVSNAGAGTGVGLKAYVLATLS